VFLGLDHGFGPIFADGQPEERAVLFETMVFIMVGTEKTLQVQERCSTWDEAEAQHQEVAASVRVGIAG
jgi:hypothetical protein